MKIHFTKFIKWIKNNLEQILKLSFISIVLIYAILADFSIIKVPTLFFMNFKNSENLILNLFNVQATVATISIAICSIISGTTSKYIYGISLSQYVSYIKPKILKHNRLLIFSLIITFFNCFLISYGCYNTSIAIFIISIFIAIILIDDTYLIFRGDKKIKNEIKEYILSNYRVNYKKNKLDNFRYELIDNFNVNKNNYIKENLDMLKEIFEKEFSNINIDYPSIINEIQEIISKTFLNIYNYKNDILILYILSLIIELYKIANKQKKVYPLSILDNIAYEYCNSLKFLSEEQLLHSSIITDIHEQLYKNQTFSNNNGKLIPNNSKYLIYYCSDIYQMLLQSKIIENKNWLIKSLFDEIHFSVVYLKAKNEQTKLQLLNEYCLFLKNLIDYGNFEVLKYKFFQELSFYYTNMEFKIVFCIVCIYLYYTSCREEFLKGSTRCNNAKKIINDNQSVIQNYIYSVDFYNILKENKNFINNFLKYCEYIPDKEAKQVIIDSVSVDFFVFSSLNQHWDANEILPIVKELVGQDPFYLYSHYFSGNNNTFFSLFKEFQSLFMKSSEEINLNDISEKEEILRTALNKLYKITEIENGKKQTITKDELSSFKNSILKSYKKLIEDNQFLFDNTLNKTNSKIHKSYLAEFRLISQIFKEPKLNFYLLKTIQNSIISEYISSIKTNTITRKVNHTNKTKQQTLIDLLNESNIKGNMFIGNIDKFYDEDNPSLLINYTKNMTIVKYPDGYNSFYVINSSLVHIKICNINVEINDLNDKEIKSLCKEDENGNLLFNVTNDIYIPFEFNELSEHIHNIRKKVKIYADVYYKVDNDIVGAGINIVFKN